MDSVTIYFQVWSGNICPIDFRIIIRHQYWPEVCICISCYVTWILFSTFKLPTWPPWPKPLLLQGGSYLCGWVWCLCVSHFCTLLEDSRRYRYHRYKCRNILTDHTRVMCVRVMPGQQIINKPCESVDIFAWIWNIVAMGQRRLCDISSTNGVRYCWCLSKQTSRFSPEKCGRRSTCEQSFNQGPLSLRIFY